MDEKPDHGTPRAVQAGHELLAWLIPLLDQFPRSRRFTLGERLETSLLAVLEALVEAAYSCDKRAALTRANLRLAVDFKSNAAKRPCVRAGCERRKPSARLP